MPFIPMRGWGRFGVIQDTPSETLQLGSWSDALNVRFVGGHLEKMLEPDNVVEDADGRPTTGETGQNCRYGITWSDGFSTYVAAVFRRSDGLDYVYRWDQRVKTPDVDNPVRWELIGGPFDPGPWQGFQWGNTFIINNGTTAPQIFDRELQRLVDLPNWGMISSADDILSNSEPSVDTQSTCRIITPLKNYLVALNVTESGTFQPNKVWWSDATSQATIDGAPSWDYESPTTMSGQREVGIGQGDIVTAKELNENLIIYTDSDCTAMQVVGGRFVMDTRRLFNKGCAGLHCVVEFNNQHFVVARDQVYIHDGSTPRLIAQDRVEREFFKRVDGRYGPEFY